MHLRPILRAALIGLSLGSCTAMGGSESLGGPGDATFELVSESPADRIQTAPLGSTITLTFNVPIDPASVTARTISVTPDIYGDLTVEGPTLTFDPAGDLRPATTYVFELSPELRGTNGAVLGPQAHHYGFKTGGEPPPDQPPTQGPRPR